MPLNIRVGSSWVPHKVFVRVGSSWVEHHLRRWTGSAWEFIYQKVAPVLSAAAGYSGPSTLSGASGSTSGLSATGVNGSTPYSYSWVRSTGSTKITLSNANTATPTINWSGLAVGENPSGTFTVTVTDSTGATATSVVTFDFTRTS